MPNPSIFLAIKVTWRSKVLMLSSLTHRGCSMLRSPCVCLSLQLKLIVESFELLFSLHRHLCFQCANLRFQVSYLLILLKTLIDRLPQPVFLLILFDVELCDEGATSLKLHLKLVSCCLNEVLVIGDDVLENLVRLRICYQQVLGHLCGETVKNLLLRSQSIIDT